VREYDGAAPAGAELLDAMSTFLLSYPGPTWRIIGAGNFRSQSRAETDPRRALAEWVRLADALVSLGAELAVLPPPEHEPPLTGMVYTANAGQLFQARFLLSHMVAAHRQEEGNFLGPFLSGLGLRVERAEHPWEGQAELTTDGAGRYLLSWGVRSAPESAVEIGALLPAEAKILRVQIKPPFYHGDTCLGLFRHPEGRALLLVYPGALLGKTPADLERFFGPDVEVLPIQEQDALAYACNSLAVNGTVLVPRGLSAGLHEALRGRGFEILELGLDELFGKGGGGPRALVNNLGGFSIPEQVRYSRLRDQITAGL
jgi:N-dimethylarginine dimethylaminohydrolase